MIFKQYYLQSLSHASYLIGDEDSHTATLVDPQRDIDHYLTDLDSHHLTLKYIFLTHFHADFVARSLVSEAFKLRRMLPRRLARKFKIMIVDFSKQREDGLFPDPEIYAEWRQSSLIVERRVFETRRQYDERVLKLQKPNDEV